MKLFTYFLPLFIALSFSKCGALETSSSNMNTALVIDTKTIELELRVPEPQGTAISGMQHGYNIPNFFHFYNAKDVGLKGILSEINAKIIRFPGGTTANFYHPNKAGYGYSIKDVTKMREGAMKRTMMLTARKEQQVLGKRNIKRNFIDDLISFSKAHNTAVIYVANMFSGTDEETLQALHKLSKAGVNLAAVELGNEYYLGTYEQVFPNVGSYLKRATQLCKKVKDDFPELQVGIVAAPDPDLKGVSGNEAEKLHAWNKAVGAADFYDAYIAHLYLFPRECEGLERGKVFDCANELTNTFIAPGLSNALNYYQEHFGSMKPLWISEWNIHGASKYFGNSLFQAQFYAEFALEMSYHQQAIPLATHHNLMALGKGFNLISRNNGAELSRTGQRFSARASCSSASLIAGIAGSRVLGYAPDRPIKGVRFDLFEKNGIVSAYITNRSANALAVTLPEGYECTMLEGINAPQVDATFNDGRVQITEVKKTLDPTQTTVTIQPWSITLLTLSINK